MGVKVIRETDLTCGHCYNPTPAADFSSDVFVNGLGAVRENDPIVPHTWPSIPNTHGGNFQGLGRQVFVNGKELIGNGNPVSCGDTTCNGSDNVFVGF